MTSHNRTVIGIDVGGPGKGFHAVALHFGRFEARHFRQAKEAAEWSLAQDAEIVAIDAPCAWARSGGSRLSERSLQMDGATIQCFKTPERTSATGRDFYGWVFNGEKLYRSLLQHYRLFDGMRRPGKTVFETFPHLIACALAGRVIPAKPKATTRRRLLREQGYDDTPLANIDYVDAALCAVTAERFAQDRTIGFGTQDEGFILAPS